MCGRIKGKNGAILFMYIAPRGVNSAVLFVHRTGYTYGKEPESFQRFFSAVSALDKTVSVRTKPVLSGFDVILSSKSANLVCLMVESEC